MAQTKEEIKKEICKPELVNLNNATCSKEVSKHKIPYVNTGCSPCKVVKLNEEAGATASVRNISNILSSATVTSENLANEVHYEGLHNSFRPTNAEKQSNQGLIVCNPNLYFNVLDIFPHIERTYLLNLCNEKKDLNEIINILLDQDTYHPNIIEVEEVNPIIPRATNSSSVVRDINNSLLGDLTEIFQEPTEHASFRGPNELNVNAHEDHLMLKTEIVGARPVNTQLNTDIIEEIQEHQLTLQTDSVRDRLENAQLEFLIQILPDADPSFLESKSKLGENELREFISEALESNNYPKQKTKVAETPEEVDVGLFTTSFDMEHFLKIFPDPVTFFMDENRKCQSINHACQFLKRSFRHHTLKNINEKYTKANYNMSRAFEALSKDPPTRVTKRSMNEIKMPEEKNLLFLQEACFVEHKNEIMEHLNIKKEEKRFLYDMAKEKGELIECGCCFEQSVFEDCAACNEGDLFCKSCIKRSAEVRIGDGLSTFPCLIDCGSEFSLHLLQDLLPANVFSRLIKRIQLEEVRAADIEGLEVCPFCEFATIPPSDTNIFTCLNPDCLKESCRKCHKLSHIPQRCEEVENDDQAKARKYIEDEMTKALVRECYKCKKSFIKQDGCNKMRCTCGAIMCYICRQPIVDYKHFNGPGGEKTSKCPLYSSDQVLHVDAVKAVAEEALKHVSATNPTLELKHDPTKVLPANTKSSLPPGVQEDRRDLIQRLNNQTR